MKYWISEIFTSLQGEGTMIGRTCIFIRLAGCSRKCKFCDTKYAQKRAEAITLEDVIRVVEDQQKFKHGPYPVIITGGEPAEQDCRQLIARLHDNPLWFVGLETSGDIYRKWFNMVEWFTVSPKPPSAGKSTSLKQIRKCLEEVGANVFTVKVVVDPASMEDLAYANTVYDLVKRSILTTDFVLQPVGGSLSGVHTLAYQVRILGMTHARVLPQMHKLVGLR